MQSYRISSQLNEYNYREVGNERWIILAKVLWKSATLLNPVPVVMVTCKGMDGKDNIITVAWAGIVNSEPPMLSISVRKERYSYQMIQETGEFVVNLTTKKLAFATDYCGVKSGRQVDKFEHLGLGREAASMVKVPMIKESPINLECRVEKVLELGSHDMFIAKILAVNVKEELINENGKLCLEKANLICYSHGEYWDLHKPLGYFGYSISKKKRQNEHK